LNDNFLKNPERCAGMAQAVETDEDWRGPLRDKRWLVEIHSVPPQGLRREISATPAEREAVAKQLELIACAALDARCDVKASGRHRFRVTTQLVARVTQTCVVTAEPLDAIVSELQTTEFWPANEITPAGADETIDPSTLEVPSAITSNTIDLGQHVYELLGTSIEPYPRKPGAQFEWEDPAANALKGPFAVLDKLKDN
jgi:hypothetical protein